MCGIVGIIGRTASGLSFKDIELLEWMLVTDTIRGKDSTGAFVGFKNKQVRSIKIATHPFNLFQTSDWYTFRNDTVSRGKFVIGHNRAATRGSVKTENAHPFVEDNIILVHNGTLWSHDNLTLKEVEVDSHAIAHALTEKKPEEVLPNIQGAFALVWYDTKTETLHAARNRDRPLFILETDHHYILASEPWIAGGPLSKQDRTINEIIEISPGSLMSWDSNGRLSTSSFELRANTYIHVVDNVDYSKYYEYEKKESPPFENGGSETPIDEIQDLREVLAGVEKKPSMNCVLTQRKDIATGHILTPSEEERAFNAARALMCIDENFKPDSRILVKIWNTYTDSLKTDRYRWTGKVIHPGKAMIDAWGYLPRGVQPGKLRDWIETPNVGSIMFMTNTQNGGPGVFIQDLVPAQMTPIHMGEVPWIVWKHSCECSSCGSKVEAWEKYFTQVKVKGLFDTSKDINPINEVSVLCPTCISGRMPIGNFKNSFDTKYRNAKEAVQNARKAKNANSNSSVQDGEQVSQAIGSSLDPRIALPSPASLQ